MFSHLLSFPKVYPFRRRSAPLISLVNSDEEGSQETDNSRSNKTASPAAVSLAFRISCQHKKLQEIWLQERPRAVRMATLSSTQFFGDNVVPTLPEKFQSPYLHQVGGRNPFVIFIRSKTKNLPTTSLISVCSPMLLGWSGKLIRLMTLQQKDYLFRPWTIILDQT